MCKWCAFKMVDHKVDANCISNEKVTIGQCLFRIKVPKGTHCANMLKWAQMRTSKRSNIKCMKKQMQFKQNKKKQSQAHFQPNCKFKSQTTEKWEKEDEENTCNIIIIYSCFSIIFFLFKEWMKGAKSNHTTSDHIILFHCDIRVPFFPFHTYISMFISNYENKKRIPLLLLSFFILLFV